MQRFIPAMLVVLLLGFTTACDTPTEAMQDDSMQIVEDVFEETEMAAKKGITVPYFRYNMCTNEYMDGSYTYHQVYKDQENANGGRRLLRHVQYKFEFTGQTSGDKYVGHYTVVRNFKLSIDDPNPWYVTDHRHDRRFWNIVGNGSVYTVVDWMRHRVRDGNGEWHEVFKPNTWSCK